ncbi:MAG: hypothetical protein QW279_08535 [Candidatus Jordarchaeaceae archaeon]
MYLNTSKKLQELRRLLVEKGFKVKQHCCEYFLIKNNQFIGVLSLFPNWNQVILTSTKIPKTEKAVTEILELVKKIFPKLEVETRNMETRKPQPQKTNTKIDNSSSINKG